MPPFRNFRGEQPRRDERTLGPRVNFHIRVPLIRVVRDGEQLGIMSPDQARAIAQEDGLDLVEIVAHAKPPVCHILDYSKYRYEQKLKEKESRKKQKQSEQKEIKLRPNIQDNDVETKAKAARSFLEDGKTVQVTLQFRRRELHHKDQGFAVMNNLVKLLEDVGTPERMPKMEGDRLCCRLVPKKPEAKNAKPATQPPAAQRPGPVVAPEQRS